MALVGLTAGTPRAMADAALRGAFVVDITFDRRTL
jgi:hypothetical protein